MGKLVVSLIVAITHTILYEHRYFSNLIPNRIPFTTILGPLNLIEGYGMARLLLSNGTEFTIKEAIFSPRSRRILLSFKDIRENNYHAKTTKENGMVYLCITSYLSGHKHILKKMECHSYGLHIIAIRSIEANYITGQKLMDSSTYLLWHNHLEHAGLDMMRSILKSSHGHSLSNKDLVHCNRIRQACSLKKLMHDHPRKDKQRNHSFSSADTREICGPIQPPYGSFRYFMVLVDVSTHWSHICLLSIRNDVFAKLTQISKLRVHHSDYPKSQ